MATAATNRGNARHIIASLIGVAVVLLLARLVLRLLAARPDNPVFSVLFAITTPPPLLAELDRQQPRFGAVLEFSTLALLLVLLVVGLLVAYVGKRRRAASGGEVTHG